MTKYGSEPPPELGGWGAQLWTEMIDEYDSFAPGELRLLREMCMIEDRVMVLNQAVSADGEMVIAQTTGEWKTNPALVELRAQQLNFARLLAALRLPDADGLTPQKRQARGIYLTKKVRGIA